MEIDFLSLPNHLLHSIIDQCPDGTRRSLRCVNRRLRALVDEHLTEIDLLDLETMNETVFVNWGRYPNVKTLKMSCCSPAAVAAMLSSGWQLEAVKFECICGSNDLSDAYSWPTLDALTLTEDLSPHDSVSIFQNLPWNLTKIELQSDGALTKDLVMLPADSQLRTSLRSLTLTGGTPQPTSIFKRPWSALEELRLHYFTIQPQTATAISTAAQRGLLPRLRVLDLSLCRMKNKTIKALLRHGFHTIEELDFHDAEMHCDVGEIFTESAANFLQIRILKLIWVSPEQMNRILSLPWPDSLDQVDLCTYEPDEWAAKWVAEPLSSGWSVFRDWSHSRMSRCEAISVRRKD